MNGERKVNSKMEDQQCPALVNAKPMPELKDSASASNTSAIYVPSDTVASTQIDRAFIEHYLQFQLCQSRIGGRRGSSACTIMAILMSHRFLCK